MGIDVQRCGQVAVADYALDTGGIGTHFKHPRNNGVAHVVNAESTEAGFLFSLFESP